MKQFLIALLFYSRLIYSSYEEELNGFLKERNIIFSKNIEETLSMSTDERICLAFFSKGCGFDHLLNQKFYDYNSFRALARRHRFQILAYEPKRHMARFESGEELAHFTERFFGERVYKDAQMFPTKLVICLLKREG